MTAPVTFWLALDDPDPGRVGDWIRRARALPRPPGVRLGFKVGLALYAAAGPAWVRALAEQDAVFLDLKFHDIPRTVERATAVAAGWGVELLTVHVSGGEAMCRAAAGAAAGHGLSVVGVTVLTSLGAEDLAALGWAGGPGAAVLHLAGLAARAGLDGVVLSPAEAPVVGTRLPQLRRVVPGIRLPGDAPGDQRRVGRPGPLVAAGVRDLVLGRALTAAPDWAAAWAAILEDVTAEIGEEG
ncbi:Orotidine 5'-phosphate decarboxylase [Candidatus Hydrogenisulfobacillus filiaventi]|uniref:Orotidine 5'-phosphate decarboxylase n=1 Tax=Candidatus Hydrogenisulfobacillus filiaventi TaxID=2707344 RepID=A0A6F8ZFH4_9FIRM|nr:orotidine-5'-phosphate decarboxylase [Bacillota bacterium]CAB1128495.1 Orotidine 5'-phosphate decarboxylase [Candidatus Hydrogenisulfobacillus filiaventi]